MAGRIVAAADFERVLGQPPLARSAHFALHHLAAAPARRSFDIKLSTDGPEVCTQPVDESRSTTRPRHWLGLVVPKRHAREATTRNLIRRQAREAFRSRADELAGGLWLLRLRRGFDRRQFASPASTRLRAATRAEIDALLQRAAAR